MDRQRRPVAAKAASCLALRHRRGAAGHAREHDALRDLRHGQLASERRRRGREGRHAGRDRVGNAAALEPPHLLGERAVDREIAGMQPRDVEARGMRRTNSASIWSSVSGAVSMMRAPAGQCASSSARHQRARIEAHRAARDEVASAHRDEIGRARPGADEMHRHARLVRATSAQVAGAERDARRDEPRLGPPAASAAASATDGTPISARDALRSRGDATCRPLADRPAAPRRKRHAERGRGRRNARLVALCGCEVAIMPSCVVRGRRAPARARSRPRSRAQSRPGGSRRRRSIMA